MTYSVKSIRFPLLLYILKFILNKNGSNRKFSFMLLLSVYLTPLYSQTGYLREAEASFCMDDCGIYYLEDEYGEFITWVTLLDNLEMLEPYVHRFVDIEGEEVTCVECTAINVSSISMSDACEFLVDCFVDRLLIVDISGDNSAFSRTRTVASCPCSTRLSKMWVPTNPVAPKRAIFIF